MQMPAGQEIWRAAPPSVRESVFFLTAGEASCPERLLAYLSPRSAAGAADGSFHHSRAFFLFLSSRFVIAAERQRELGPGRAW